MFDRLPLGRWHGNFETHTIKVVLSSWDKEAIMPSMRMAVCFDGRIFIHDHIPNNTLGAPPLPMFQISYVLFLGLFTVRQSMHLYILFVIHFFTAQTSSVCFTPNTTPCDTYSFHVYLRFPIPPLPFFRIPSTAQRSENLLKFHE